MFKLSQLLKKTDNQIYYYYDYIPTKLFRYHSEQEISISKSIWDYKNGVPEAINKYTNDLMLYLSWLSRDIPSDKIGLVAVPPSKVGKYSPIRESISNIVNCYRQGIISDDYFGEKVLYDYGNLLQRYSDISTSHLGRKASYEEQKESIICSRDRLSRYWTTFIILDDVTTRGTSMDVCRDILLEHGAKEQYIYRFAIAKTV